MGLSGIPTVARAVRRSESAKETQRLAEALGRMLGDGDIVALVGDLGAGKTCFVQGLAVGLGCDPEVAVASPTFTIVNVYPGVTTLQHLDLYRLGSGDELEMIGLRDMFERGVLAVEWFDRFADEFPDERLEIVFAFEPDPEARHLELCGRGARAVSLIDELLRQGLVDRPGQPSDA